MFQIELANKKFYKANIDKIKLRLAKLQELDEETQKFRAMTELKKGWKDVDGVVHYQRLQFISEII